jgi:hypothetical protein
MKIISENAFNTRNIPFNIYYFDGCGVGSNLWKLRPLMIKEVLKCNIN